MFSSKSLAFAAVLLASLATAKESKSACSQGLTLREFGECLVSESEICYSTTRGYNLDLEPLDPLPLGSFEVKTGDFVIGLRDAVMSGLSDAKIVDVGWDFNQNTSYVILSGNMVLTGNYRASGKILFLPVISCGKLTVNARDSKIKATYFFRKTVDEDGKEHLDTYDFKTSQEFGLLEFNVKSGNKIVDMMTNAALNANWQSLATEGPAKVAGIIANKVGGSANGIFRLLPFDEVVKYI